MKKYLKFEYTSRKINFIKKKYTHNDISSITKKLALNSKEKCKSINCNLLFVYIPNNEILRPNILSKLNTKSLFKFLKNHNIEYIDMNRYFKNFSKTNLYSIRGPHLSPYGYKLVANKINKYLSEK